MSRILSELLGYDTAYFSRVLAELESTVDGHAIDARLVGELAERSAALHRQLRLDPADTTPRELYVVLRSRVADDNQRLAGAMGGRHPDAVSEMTPLLLKSIRAHVGTRHCWAMKPAVAKKLLKQHPPRLLMKALGYRSIDSMLKHEPIGHVMVAMRVVESAAWNEAMTRRYASLTPADFESRPVAITYLDKPAYIAALAPTIRRHRLVLHSKEMGIVALVPTKENVVRGYTLRTATLMLHYVAEISMVSSLLKYRHAGSQYGAAVVEALLGDATGHVTLGGHAVHWRSAHAAIGEAAVDVGPHMADEDWQFESANDSIARLVETMLLWRGYGHGAAHHADPVGSNVVDLAIDHADNAEFSERSLRFMRRELEQELFRRYLLHTPIRHVAFVRLGIR